MTAPMLSNLHSQTTKLAAALVRDAIGRGEGARLEFKSSSQKEVVETLAALANTGCASILIGVSDNGRIVNLAILLETVQGWVNQCKQNTSPCVIPDIDLIDVDNKTVAVVSVGEYAVKPVPCKGRYFKRVRNANHQMSASVISNSHIKLINSSWDYHPYPEHSATRTVIIDSIISKDTLIEQVDRIMGFIVKHTNKAYIITGNPKRKERWDYPIDALSEIVISTIVHRDYRCANDSTFKIFGDRIEFTNLGALLDDQMIEKIKICNYKSHLRNKQITPIFKELELIEKYGSGERRLIEIFVANGLPELVFEST